MRRPVTLRARLTLLFAAATAAVLLVVGLAVFVLFSLGITGSIDDGLRQRARALEAVARDERTPTEIRADSGEPLLQLYAPDGTMLTGTRALGTHPVLTRAEVARAARAPFSDELEHAPTGGEARIRAFGVDGGRLVAVIGESLDREHDLRVRLAVLLAIVLPAALLAASYLGYRLAGAALAPVERMRARAAQITDSDLSERLPLPRSQDEIARLGRTFNGLLDRLAAAIARERRIVSDASHELRTPLAVLSAELQVAARPDRTPGQLHEAVVSALEETGRLTRLADDLLVLARSDDGNLPLRLEPLDVGDVLRDVARRNNSAIRAAGRELTTHVDIDGGAVVLADPDRVAQALDNLVGNALQHGAGSIAVRAGSGAPGYVELSVRDGGPGFGGALDQAFDRFSQGDPSRGAGAGTGLGLAIVDAIARAHGGDARAEDLAGGGARVTVALPAA
jgi:two-component system, OmpR family, sensor kinase